MKRLIPIIGVFLLLFACTKPEETPINPNDPEDKPGKETLIIKVSNIDYSSFTVSVTSNSQKTYFYDVVEKAVWDADGGETVWKNCVKKDEIQSGNSQKNYDYQKAVTQYIAFAAFCDKNGVKEGGFITEEFVTDTGLGGDDPSPISFSVSNVTNNSFTLITSSTSSEKYFFDIVEKSDWDQYGAQAVWESFVESYIEYGIFTDLLVSGNSSYDYEDLEGQEYVAFAAYCYNDGTLKGSIFSKEINLAGSGSTPTPTLSSIYINTSLAVIVGENKYLTVTGWDDNNTRVDSPIVKWKSSKTSVATIDQNGQVKAIGVGIATITATSVKGNASDNCYVLVVPNLGYYEQPVDLGLSVKWAQCNIGANRPEEYGSYHSWGATAQWTAAMITCPYLRSFSWTSQKDEAVDADGRLYQTRDPANQLLGNNWRLPTEKECQELIDRCSAEEITLNGHEGYLFISKKQGYTDKWLFMPYTGACWAGIYADPSKERDAEYWTSMINSTAIYNYYAYETARTLFISHTNNYYGPSVHDSVIESGNPIRPVYSEEFYFDVIVTDIKSNQCLVTVGTNSSDTYFVAVVPGSYYNQYGAATLCQALIKSEKDNGNLSAKLFRGDNSFSYPSLDSKTNYAVVAVFCDTNGVIKGDAYSRVFNTK